ncbi:MAG: hypothetical protein CMJ18_22040 [Phycisphaeraceae bacterium]|nr:hypothetical protein [Phycisphaeraceae bacterium]
MEAARFDWVYESNVVYDPEVEVQERFADPDTGVGKLRLTSAPWISTHVYPEIPVSTPDGQRFLFHRINQFSGRRDIWIADVPTLRIRQVSDEQDVRYPVIAPDGAWFYYVAGRTIVRFDPQTCARETCGEIDPRFGAIDRMCSISLCGHRMLIPYTNDETSGIGCFELATGAMHVVYEHPECFNTHLQYSRCDPHRLVFQVNDGVERDENGTFTRLVGKHGCSIHVINDDGTGHEVLNVGRAEDEHVQGHHCWIGRENRIITTTHRRARPGDRWSQDRIVTIAPGETSGTVVCEGGPESFTHVHVTSDGRHWVSDCNRTAKIYVGSVATGQHRLFCSSGTSFGAPQWTHPHPFFLGDDRTIGWNSDESGIPHIYVGRIPEGFVP